MRPVAMLWLMQLILLLGFPAVSCSNVTRLVDGDNSCSGRVEVFDKGQWKRVCDDGWDLNNCKVVCTELGCGAAVDASYAYFGQGSGSMWNYTVQCNGNESTLKSCTSNQSANCSNKGAGVICQSPVLLVNGTNPCSGRVEVRFNGVYGTVCDDGWNLTDAAVVCRTTGCGDALAANRAAYFENYSGKVWMNNVSCNGKESTLLDCAHTKTIPQNCSHEMDAGVTCGPKLRLQNGSSSCSGRVEVLHNGTWGTVCDDGWDLQDAEVVCGEIGCGYATEAKKGAFFGKGSGPIWINNLNCNGNEITLKRCRSSGWDVQNCNHSKDAGVICQNDSSSSTTAKSSSTTQVTSTSAAHTTSSLTDISSVSYDSSSSTTAKSSSTTQVTSTSAAHTTSSLTDISSVSFNFIFINQSKSWIDALRYCKAHHQTLVHILNGTAQQYITQMLQAKQISGGVWIGLERDMLYACSPWLWTGGPNVDYKAWNELSPVDAGSRFCGKLQRENNTFGWMDACCFEKLPFICQG